jgi:hypothetical protein
MDQSVWTCGLDEQMTNDLGTLRSWRARDRHFHRVAFNLSRKLKLVIESAELNR